MTDLARNKTAAEELQELIRPWVEKYVNRDDAVRLKDCVECFAEAIKPLIEFEDRSRHLAAVVTETTVRIPREPGDPYQSNVLDVKYTRGRYIVAKREGFTHTDKTGNQLRKPTTLALIKHFPDTRMVQILREVATKTNSRVVYKELVDEADELDRKDRTAT